MKPYCCQLTISCLARVFVLVDIFRGMVVSAILIGIFCGMSSVYLEKLPEVILPGTTIRVDYHWNRENLVACIVIGIALCGIEILMALAMDHILNTKHGQANLIWVNCSLLGIFVRIAFYTFICKKEVYLGLNRLDDLTPTVNKMMRTIFLAAVAYEIVKVVQVITGAALQMELREKTQLQKRIEVKSARNRAMDGSTLFLKKLSAKLVEMKKKTIEEGGVACGICSISLQEASLGFGIAEISHGILGITVTISMIIKKESDALHPDPRISSKDKISAYTKFVDKCPVWAIYLGLAAFTLQIILGILLCIGASNRSSFLCSLWAIASFLASPLTPMSYCILGLGRIFEWTTVAEFIWKIDEEQLEYGMENKKDKNSDGFYVDANKDDDEEFEN